MKAIGITNQRETVVIWDRKTGKPIHKAIVWQDRRTAEHLRGAEGRRASSRCSPSKTGLLLDPYFSGTKIALAPRQCEGRAREGGEGRARLRHHRQLPDLAAHRRQGACDRCHQRLAHAALQHPHRRSGTTSCCASSTFPRSLLPEVKDCAADFGATDPKLSRRGHPDLRRGGRPAGGHHRPGLLRARHDEIDLWHGLLRAAQHRRQRRALAATGCSPPSPISWTASAPMRWKARSSLPAPPCNGCATG